MSNKIVVWYRKSPKTQEQVLKRVEDDSDIEQKIGLKPQMKVRW